MIRWDRLGALVVPVVVIAALACLVRGATLFGEQWGWVAGGASLLFLAFVADRDSGAEQAQPEGVADIRNAQTQRIAR